MFGLGLAFVVVLIMLLIGHRHESISTGVMWFGVIIGLLLASIVPGLPNNVHNFVTSTITSIENTNTNK